MAKNFFLKTRMDFNCHRFAQVKSKESNKTYNKNVAKKLIVYHSNKTFSCTNNFIFLINKVAISVMGSTWLFVCPIITHKLLDRFDSKFYWGTR